MSKIDHTFCIIKSYFQNIVVDYLLTDSVNK